MTFPSTSTALLSSISTLIGLANLAATSSLRGGDLCRGYIMDEFEDDFSILDTSIESLCSNISELSDLSLKR